MSFWIASMIKRATGEGNLLSSVSADAGGLFRTTNPSATPTSPLSKSSSIHAPSFYYWTSGDGLGLNDTGTDV